MSGFVWTPAAGTNSDRSGGRRSRPVSYTPIEHRGGFMKTYWEEIAGSAAIFALAAYALIFSRETVLAEGGPMYYGIVLTALLMSAALPLSHLLRHRKLEAIANS